MRQDLFLNQSFGLVVQEKCPTLRATGHKLPAIAAGYETLVSAIAQWRNGKLTEVLGMMRAMAQAAESQPAVSWIGHPRMAVAAILTYLREFDQARDAIGEVEKNVDFVLSGVLRIIRAQLELAAGRADVAVEEATAGLAIAEKAEVRLYTPIALAVLTMVALRRGDLVEVSRCESLARQATPAGAARSPVELWVQAQVASARGDRMGCGEALERICDVEQTRHALVAEEPAAAAWVVRTALAMGRQEWAALAASSATSSHRTILTPHRLSPPRCMRAVCLSGTSSRWSGRSTSTATGGRGPVLPRTSARNWSAWTGPPRCPNWTVPSLCTSRSRPSATPRGSAAGCGSWVWSSALAAAQPAGHRPDQSYRH